MANTKSAEKRIRGNERNRQRNQAARTFLRGQVKKFRAAVAALDVGASQQSMREAQSAIDKTAKKGIIHARAASRYKARLAKAHLSLVARVSGGR